DATPGMLRLLERSILQDAKIDCLLNRGCCYAEYRLDSLLSHQLGASGAQRQHDCLAQRSGPTIGCNVFALLSSATGYSSAAVRYKDRKKSISRNDQCPRWWVATCRFRNHIW